MRYIVTGANGFVGRALLNRLSKDKSLEVLALSRKPFDVTSLGLTIKLISFDASDECWLEVLSAGDVVIHLAGRAHVIGASAETNHDSFCEINVEATDRLARLCAKAGVRRFVYVSSIGVHGGSNDGPISENTALNPVTDYARSKLEAEIRLKQLSVELGFELVIVRPVLVYGADAPGNFRTLTKIVRLAPVLPFGLCQNRRSLISVDNLADFLYLCSSHPRAAGEEFVISDGDDVSLRMLTSSIADGLGKKVFQLPIPVSLMQLGLKVLGRGSQSDQLFGDLYVDDSKAGELLGWAAPECLKVEMMKLKSAGKVSGFNRS